MAPITLTTSIRLHRPATEVLEAVFDESNWLSFTGYGLLPSIRAVTITPGADGRVGTSFAVTNTDGSTHAETVTEYEPGRRLVLRMDSFSKPLSRFADHFVETWRVDERVLTRSFDLVPRNLFGAVMLRLIRPMMRRAVEVQNRTMASA